LTVVLFAQSVNPVDFVHPWHRNVAPARRGDVVRVRTLSGLGVYVSREGQQCWDAPLPCTWRLDPRLRLRVPGDLGSGFVLGPGSEPPPPAVVR
jgi:hypothetical protein